MKKILLGIGIGMAMLMSLDSIAISQELKEIVVTAKGVLIQKAAGKTASGVPIVDTSLSYGVSYAGLDLASAAGAAELEKRVKDAAAEACKEIADRSPNAQFTTTEQECTTAAANKALAKAHALIAAAGKKAAS